MQTGQNQAPQRRWWKKVMSSSQEVNVAGRCRCPQPPQQTTTKKRLQRRTRLAIVVCTCQVRNVYLTFYPFKNSFLKKIFYCLFVCLFFNPCWQTDPDNKHTSRPHNTSDPQMSVLSLAEVLESFMATREAMQVQQNVTVYESFGTSTLPSSMESPVSPDRELDPKQQWDKQRESEESLSFPVVCHLVVSRCLFLLLGIRPAWVDPSEREETQAVNNGAR